MKRLNEDLRTGSFAPIYLLYGSEDYLRSQYKKRFRDEFSDRFGDVNVSLFADKSVDLKEVRQMTTTVPFFAAGRLVLVENSGWFQKKREDVQEMLEALPLQTTLVFVETEIDKRGRLYKYVAAHGYVAELGEQPPKVLLSWMQKQLRDAGKQADPALLAGLLDRLGSSMLLIENELKKLIAYLGDREELTDADIRAIGSVTAADHIFEMTKAAGRGDTATVLKLFTDLMYLKQEPLRILALLVSQYQKIWKAKDLLEQGKGRKELTDRLGVPGWSAGDYIEQARRYSLSELRNIIEQCATYDEGVKTGQIDPRIGLEGLLIRMSRKLPDDREGV
ncbi:MAG: DNA polymerase III subunit delta [Lachnospiraceae bacterium]|nr:DNA polymerase III subunit delta [Lachnospiraceae bacterium]MDY5742232.1 DNA polymerase III subunit delta [Lachnospiraceae bacterium]